MVGYIVFNDITFHISPQNVHSESKRYRDKVTYGQVFLHAFQHRVTLLQFVDLFQEGLLKLFKPLSPV